MAAIKKDPFVGAECRLVPPEALAMGTAEEEERKVLSYFFVLVMDTSTSILLEIPHPLCRIKLTLYASRILFVSSGSVG